MLLMSKQQLFEDNTYSPLAMEEIHTNVHVYVAVEIALSRSMPASLQKCFAFFFSMLDHKYLVLLYCRQITTML